MKASFFQLHLLLWGFISSFLLLPLSAQAEHRYTGELIQAAQKHGPQYIQEDVAWGMVFLLLLISSIGIGLLSAIVFAAGGPIAWLYIALGTLGASLLFGTAIFFVNSSHPHSSQGVFAGVALLAIWMSFLLHGIPLLIAGLVQSITWLTILGSAVLGIPLLVLILIQIF